MKERLEILIALGDSAEKLLISSNNELYGACRHRSKFHRLTNTTKSNTDEGINPEKGIETSVTSPSYYQELFNSRNSICMYINIEFINLNDNHAAISPLAIKESTVGYLNGKIVRDM